MIRPRVLVTDAQERSVLAVIRCLGAAGYEVSAIATTRMAPGLWSHIPTMRHLAPDPQRDVNGFITSLQTLLGASPHDILVAGTDPALSAISEHRDKLEPYVRLGLPEHVVVERALDKQSLAGAASSVGLAPPEARLCHSVDEVLAAAAAFDYPVLIKPVQVVHEQSGGAHRRASVFAPDEGVLVEAAKAFGACVVQRRVSGPVISFAGAATANGMIGFVMSRYVRTWPAAAGSVCFSETVTAPASLIERVQALLKRLQWLGMFELELIERGLDTYAAIDFNPRPYGSLSLAARAGVPVTSLWCDWVLGGNVGGLREAQVGVAYRWEDADLTHLVGRLRKGRPSSALAVARPRRRVAHAYFRLHDPAPTIARAGQILVNAAVRAGHTDLRYG